MWGGGGGGGEQLKHARKDITDGMAFLTHRQPLIKLADHSESAVVEECDNSNNSDDKRRRRLRRQQSERW